MRVELRTLGSCQVASFESTAPFFTPSEVAALCGVSRRTVNRWVANASLGAGHTPGGHYRIERETLLTFLEAHGYTDAARVLAA